MPNDARYMQIFLKNIALENDIAQCADECLEHAENWVRWHAEHEPEENVVSADEVAPFLKWMNDNREQLLAAVCLHYNNIGPTVEAAVALGKQEILADMQHGTVPATTNSFEELNNYVDAQMYAGLGACEYEWDSEEEACDYASKVRDALHDWLQTRLDNHWSTQDSDAQAAR